MKKLSLKNAENLLTRKEMKLINGGYYTTGSGGCCARAWHDYAPPLQGQYSSVACGLSMSEAQSYASGSGGGNWCCDSCGSASWL